MSVLKCEVLESLGAISVVEHDSDRVVHLLNDMFTSGNGQMPY